MAWWAAKQNGLHPRLTATLKRGLLDERNLHPKARQTWNLILEYQADRRHFAMDGSLSYLRRRISREGWTHSVLRDFAETTRPKIKRSIPPCLGRSWPPSETWDVMKLSRITRVEIKFPRWQCKEIDVPDIVLEQIFMVLEANLRQATGMRAELSEMLAGPGVGDFSMPNCYPDRKVEGEGHHRKDIRWLFVHLFERLVVYSPNSAAAIATTWPLEDPYFFRNLKLFALNHRALFDI